MTDQQSDELEDDPTLDSLKQRFLQAHMRRRRSPKAAVEMFAQAPAWLGLTPAEKRKAEDLLERVANEYPATSIAELIWCLATDSVRPRSSGRKPKWLGMDGILFVGKVEAALQARGAKSSDRKALRQVIGAIRKNSPESYGSYSEQRLRDAYYDALPRFRGLLQI